MAKRNFKQNNPALAFISTDPQGEEPGSVAMSQQGENLEETPEKAPEGYKVNPLYVETKSKRVNLLIQPSVVERMKKTAKAKGLSLNEAINEAIKAYLEREGV